MASLQHALRLACARGVTREAAVVGGADTLRNVPRWQPPPSLIVPRERVQAFGHRWHRVIVLAAITGALTGLAVVGFEAAVDGLLDHVRELPDAVMIVVPAVGLVVAWAALSWLGTGASPAVADEYLREYHSQQGRSDVRAFAARIIASVPCPSASGASEKTSSPETRPPKVGTSSTSHQGQG